MIRLCRTIHNGGSKEMSCWIHPYATTGLFLFPFVYISSGVPNLKGHSACPYKNRTTWALPDQTPCYALGLSFRKEMAKLPGLSKIRRTDWHQHGMPRAWPKLGKRILGRKGSEKQWHRWRDERNPLEEVNCEPWKLGKYRNLENLHASDSLKQNSSHFSGVSSSQASMPHPPGSCSLASVVDLKLSKSSNLDMQISPPTHEMYVWIYMWMRELHLKKALLAELTMLPWCPQPSFGPPLCWLPALLWAGTHYSTNASWVEVSTMPNKWIAVVKSRIGIEFSR